MRTIAAVECASCACAAAAWLPHSKTITDVAYQDSYGSICEVLLTSDS